MRILENKLIDRRPDLMWIACGSRLCGAEPVALQADREMDWMSMTANRLGKISQAVLMAGSSRRLSAAIAAALVGTVLLTASINAASGHMASASSGSIGSSASATGHGGLSTLNSEASSIGNLSEGIATSAFEIQNDRAALIALYRATGGDRWNNAEQWLSDDPLGDWQGVFTGKDGRVELLVLPSNGLIGRIPDEIADLDRLRVLNLAGNALSGPVPPAIGSALRLQTLKLDRNRLSGRIPAEIGDLVNLEYLELSFNRISGTIPPQLAGLSRLHTIRISDNRLSGAIPQSLGELESLKVLDLDSNRLSAGVPAEIGQLPFLVELSLSGNGISGTIPSELGLLPHLGVLDLAWNQLIGEIPAELADPPRLTSLFLGGNSLTGSIPAQFGHAANLVDLYLHDNALTGTIPAELGNLTGLRRLYLNGNRVSGQIPGSLGRIRNLETFDVSGNQLTGAIPHELGNISNMRVLNIAQNQLSGPIHPALHRLHALDVLRLGTGHQFAGCLPAHWGKVRATDVGQIQLPICPFGLPGLDAVPGRLEPEFNPGVRDYVLWLGENVEVVTIDPITAGATVEYLDQLGNEISDADLSRDGHQIANSDVAGGIRIRVTSGDGTAETTYGVTAKRLFPHHLTVLESKLIAAPGNPDLKHNVPDLEVVIDGQVLKADFLSHFNRTGEIKRWGYPTSEVLALEPNTLTQFYQRGVVDFHNVGSGWVTERRLAWDYVGGGRGGSPDLRVEEGIVNPHSGTVFGPWNHKVSNFAIDGTETGFADFFEKLGGVAAFGFPKTDARVDTNEDGTLHIDRQSVGFIRQYFQAAVLELHSYDPIAPVKLSLLGDTLRNVLVPGFERELAFSAAEPLVARSTYAPAGVATPAEYERTSRPVAAVANREFPFLDTDRFSLQLFEGGVARTRPFERPNLATFNNATSRFVWWALEVEIVPRRSGILRSPIEIRYFRPDGSIMHFDRLNIGAGLHESTERINYTGRHDLPFLGGGIPGTYRVEVSHSGKIKATAQFELLSVRAPDSGPFVELVQALPWAGRPAAREHQEALLRLTYIYLMDPEIAKTVASWEWVRSELTPRQLEVIQLLASLTHKDPEFARRVVASPWLADGISVAEWRILLGAHEFDQELAELALGSGQQDSNSIVWQIRAIRNLSRIEQELPILFAELQTQTWFVDGINESEAALVSVLLETTESEAISRELLASPLPRTRRISTKYSDEIDLTVVIRHSVRLPTNLMDRLELGVRAIEEHVAVPWPSADVIVYLEPDLNSVLDESLGGFYTHDYIAVGRSWDYLPTLYHELSHAFFFSGDEALWLQESGPEYLEHHARWKTGELSLSDWKQELADRMDWACYRYGAHTVRDYVEAVEALDGGDIRQSAMWYCHYQIGHHLIFQVRQLLGEQNVGAALNDVISIRASTGTGASDEQILEAFRARAASDQVDELNKIIESTYGAD